MPGCSRSSARSRWWPAPASTRRTAAAMSAMLAEAAPALIYAAGILLFICGWRAGLGVPPLPAGGAPACRPDAGPARREPGADGRLGRRARDGRARGGDQPARRRLSPARARPRRESRRSPRTGRGGAQSLRRADVRAVRGRRRVQRRRADSPVQRASRQTSSAARSRRPARGDYTPLGLGRSVFGLLERDQVAHALDKIHQQLDRNVERPHTRFVTGAANGAVLRVQVAPVPLRRSARGRDGVHPGRRERTDRTRRAAPEAAAGAGDRHARAGRQPARGRREPGRVSRHGGRAPHAVRRNRGGRVARAHRAPQYRAERVCRRAEGKPDAGGHARRRSPDRRAAAHAGRHRDACTRSRMWTRTCGCGSTASRSRRRLHRSPCGCTPITAIRELRFRAAASGRFAELDLVWTGAIVGSEALALWETEPMRIGADETPLTLKDVLERHGGEVWSQADRPRQKAWFRILLAVGRARRGRGVRVRVRPTTGRNTTTSTCSSASRRPARWPSAASPISPTRYSTPRPPASNPRPATRSSRSARCASSTAGCSRARSSNS